MTNFKASPDMRFVGQIKPPDVADFVPQDVIYKTDNSRNVLGDGTATGGFAPYMANEPTVPATLPDIESWTEVSNANLDDFLTTIDGGTKNEAKFRTHAAASYVAKNDPIRNHGQSGTSHLHTFFGNRTINAFSTCQTNRTILADDDGSDTAGGMLNATGYWMPSLLADKGGRTYAIIPHTVGLYYVNAPEASQHIHPLPAGLRYVSGYDMDNPNRMRDIVQQLNIDAGRDRYQVSQGINWDDPTYHPAHHAWIVENINGASGGRSFIINADGSDPFAGKMSVANGGTGLRIKFGQKLAWDGVNAWSPRGYDHVMSTIYDKDFNETVVPNGWYLLPSLEVNITWSLTRIEDFLGGPLQEHNPRLVSDAMHSTPPGGSFHIDWLNGWDTYAIGEWQRIAIGSGVLNGTPHEMNDSQLNGTQKLLLGGPTPDGRDKQMPFNSELKFVDVTDNFNSPINTKMVT